MIAVFENFCIWVFEMVDNIWKPIAGLFKRLGFQPNCGDSELIAMSSVGDYRGWYMETGLLSYWKDYRHLFPRIPSQSHFNRCRWN